MLKHIQGKSTPEVMGQLGSHIDDAKKEAQFLAAILQVPVRLYFNNHTYLIDGEGNTVKETTDLQNLIKMTEEG